MGVVKVPIPVQVTEDAPPPKVEFNETEVLEQETKSIPAFIVGALSIVMLKLSLAATQGPLPSGSLEVNVIWKNPIWLGTKDPFKVVLVGKNSSEPLPFDVHVPLVAEPPSVPLNESVSFEHNT